jgi:hypothetical protein
MIELHTDYTVAIQSADDLFCFVLIINEYFHTVSDVTATLCSVRLYTQNLV